MTAQPRHPMRPETKGPVVTDAELAEMRERAAKWVLTPAQAKARDGAAGLLVRPDDGCSDPYFTRRF
jgi:putative SOS response-associated peptidase YedK